MSVVPTTPETLRAFETFADLPDDLLVWLCGEGETTEVADGDIVFEEGDEANHMSVVIRGGLQVFLNVGGQHLTLPVQEPGAVIGLLPYSRMTHYLGSVRAVGASTYFLLHRRYFPELIARSYELGRRLVERLSTRVRESTRTEQQREKMVALGQLSAGLAHELNNPAAAVARAAGELTHRLRDAARRLPALVNRPDAAAVVEAAARLRLEACRRAAELTGASTLGDLERSEREDELADWLEERGAEEPWLLAEALVEAGVEATHLEALVSAGDGFPEAGLTELAPWLAAGVAADQLVADIAAAARRISDLVASVKEYSHMDRSAERQPTDIVKGIESTVTMLGHKMRSKSLTVRRRYGNDLPLVPAHPGELNQVWTNLIDNALDALPENGTLTVSAAANEEMMQVTIEDDGSGVPEELQHRIFEPFFTTKPMGEGSGLGLDIVQRIVEQHAGQVRLESDPGQTVFTVCLPLTVTPRPAE